MSSQTLLVVWFISCFALDSSLGQTTKSPKPLANELVIKDELSQLAEAYRLMEEELDRLIPPDGAEQADSYLADEQWLSRGDILASKVPDPNLEIAPHLIAFAQEHEDSRYALDALAFVIRRSGSDVRGRSWLQKAVAIDMVSQRHLDDPRVIGVFELLSDSLPLTNAESLLRHAFENSPHEAIRAAAGLSLARYLDGLGKAHRRSAELKRKNQLLNYERFWKIVITPYLETNFPLDQKTTTVEIGRLLSEVMENY